MKGYSYMKKGKTKVLLLHEIFTPYRVSLFNEIASFEDLEFNVFYLTKSKDTKKEWDDLKLSTNFRSKTLKGLHIRPTYERFIHINHTLLFELIKFNPDLLIIPGFNVASMQALLYAKLFKKPTIVWSEPTKYTEAHVSGFRLFLRKFMFRYMNAAITPGQLGKEYLQSLGDNRNEREINIAFQSVDTEYYYNAMENFKKDETIVEFKKQVLSKKYIIYRSNNRTQRDLGNAQGL